MSAAVKLVPEDQVGRGYGSDDLHKAHGLKVQEVLGTVLQETRDAIVSTAKTQAMARMRLEQLRVDLRRSAGDYTSEAMAVLVKLAEAELAAELAKNDANPTELREAAQREAQGKRKG